MGEVHEVICDTQQSASKIKWLLCWAGFYYPSMIANFFLYCKGCEECEQFSNTQLVPTAMMHPIIKPWPFRGWGLDFISQIHPSDQKDIALYWLLHIISQSGSKLCL